MEVAAIKGRGLWDDAARRLMRNRAAVVSMIVLAVLGLAAIIGPYLTPYAFDQINKDDVWAAPLVHGHLLGTDSLGVICWPGCWWACASPWPSGWWPRLSRW